MAGLDGGEAGASARREYERRRARREAELEQRWGPFAGVAKRVSSEPQSTTAWAKGAQGERYVAARLAKLLGERVTLLHDRRIPRTRRNIDHIAIAGSGVWVVDTKKYTGRIERRDVGERRRTDVRLFVGGRDRSKLVAGTQAQVALVREALDWPRRYVHGVLCFVDGDWQLFAKPFPVAGIWVASPTRLAQLISGSGALTVDQVEEVAGFLARRFPPAVRS